MALATSMLIWTLWDGFILYIFLINKRNNNEYHILSNATLKDKIIIN